MAQLPPKLDLSVRMAHWLSRPASPFAGTEQGLTAPRQQATEGASAHEAELVRRLQAGDTAALDGVYRAHHEALRMFAQRLVGEQAAAEDLVHDVFVALPRAIRSYRGESALRTFLLGIGAKLSQRHVRSAARRRAALERVSMASQEPQPSMDDRRARSEQARALSRALDALPAAQRAAFVLLEVEQRSASEVAAILGIPEATVRTRCFHARKRLRELLEQVAR